MAVGEFLARAGLASANIQQAENNARVMRQNQLQIEEQNRLADLKQRMAQQSLASLAPVATPTFAGLAAPLEPAPAMAGLRTPAAAATPVRPSELVLEQPLDVQAGLELQQLRPAPAPAPRSAPVIAPTATPAPWQIADKIRATRRELEAIKPPWYMPLSQRAEGQAIRQRVATLEKEIIDLEQAYKDASKAQAATPPVTAVTPPVTAVTPPAPAPAPKRAGVIPPPIPDAGMTVASMAPPPEVPPPAKIKPPAPLEVPQTRARNFEMAEYYLSTPNAIPFEMQQLQQVAEQQLTLLTQRRNETAQLAQLMMQSGTTEGIKDAMRLRDEVFTMDAKLQEAQQQVVEKQMYLTGMQGLRELSMTGDPRRLSSVMSQYMGAPVGIQGRSDGTFSLFVNGDRVRDNVSSEQLAAIALQQFSADARQAAAESARLENELALKQRYGDATINALGKVQAAIVKGEYDVAVKEATKANGKFITDAVGNTWFESGNGQLFKLNPGGTAIGTDIVTAPSATPITIPGMR